jgi:hypothetical protein
MRVSKEIMDVKTARVVDLIKGLPDQGRLDHFSLKLLYANKYAGRPGDTAIISAIYTCVKDGTCYVNNTRSWRRGVKPILKMQEATPLPFPEGVSDNDMDRFKARSCATLQGVEGNGKKLDDLITQVRGLRTIVDLIDSKLERITVEFGVKP